MEAEVMTHLSEPRLTVANHFSLGKLKMGTWGQIWLKCPLVTEVEPVMFPQCSSMTAKVLRTDHFRKLQIRVPLAPNNGYHLAKAMVKIVSTASE